MVSSSMIVLLMENTYKKQYSYCLQVLGRQLTSSLFLAYDSSSIEYATAREKFIAAPSIAAIGLTAATAAAAARAVATETIAIIALT